MKKASYLILALIFQVMAIPALGMKKIVAKSLGGIAKTMVMPPRNLSTTRLFDHLLPSNRFEDRTGIYPERRMEVSRFKKLTNIRDWKNTWAYEEKKLELTGAIFRYIVASFRLKHVEDDLALVLSQYDKICCNLSMGYYHPKSVGLSMLCEKKELKKRLMDDIKWEKAWFEVVKKEEKDLRDECCVGLFKTYCAGRDFKKSNDI